MGDFASEFAKWTPAVLVLLFVLWAGAKGFWYWGANARTVIKALERDRDQWRQLALALLHEKGITLPADTAAPPAHSVPVDR